MQGNTSGTGRLSSIILSRILLNLREASLTSSNITFEATSSFDSNLRFRSSTPQNVETRSAHDLDDEDGDLLTESSVDKSIVLELADIEGSVEQQAGPSGVRRSSSSVITHALTQEGS